MSAQAALFDPSPPPARPLTSGAPMTAARLTALDWSAFHRAMAGLPLAVARGMNVCSACELPLAPGQPALFLAVSDGRVPEGQSRLDAEQIGFHADCHDQWWKARCAQAWAIVQQGETRHGG